MKKAHSILRVILALALLLNMCPVGIFAEEDPVTSVVTKLNAIDTLQQMQTKRASFDNKEGYQAYLDDMFSKRAEAIAVYGALTDEQKAEVRTQVENLDDKLSTELPTVWTFKGRSEPVTTGSGIYAYQVIFKEFAPYEAANHYTVGKDVAMVVMIVDAEKEACDAWEPNGPYDYDTSNYMLTYCCDLVKETVGGTHYKRVNLEDADYYDEEAAKSIRAIIQASYPFISIEEMKENLREAGFKGADELTRGDIIAGVQMAIWAFANGTDEAAVEKIEGATTDKGIFNYNNISWCRPYHDYRNEVWDWWDTKSAVTEDPAAAERANKLSAYLQTLEPVSAASDQVVITDVIINSAERTQETEDTYTLNLSVSLSGISKDGGNVTITARSDSGEPVTMQVNADQTDYNIELRAKEGDEITVTAEGTQTLEKGAYFYDPEGGRTVSQCLVGVAEGSTKVHAERSVTWEALDPEPVPEEPEPVPEPVPEEPEPTPDPEPEPTVEPTPDPKPTPRHETETETPEEIPPTDTTTEETISDDDTPQAAPDDFEEEDDLYEKDDSFSGLEEEEDMEDEETPLSPFTGDARNTGLWGLISLLSLAGIAAIVTADRKRAK